MGCVQSYFRKGSYDVYEAHNAGLSPSSTQSEKAALADGVGEKVAEKVEAEELEKDLVIVDADEIKLAEKQDTDDKKPVSEDANGSSKTGAGIPTDDVGGAAIVTTAAAAGVAGAAAVVLTESKSPTGSRPISVQESSRPQSGTGESIPISSQEEQQPTVTSSRPTSASEDVVAVEGIETETPVPVTESVADEEKSSRPTSGIKDETSSRPASGVQGEETEGDVTSRTESKAEEAIEAESVAEPAITDEQIRPASATVSESGRPVSGTSAPSETESSVRPESTVESVSPAVNPETGTPLITFSRPLSSNGISKEESRPATGGETITELPAEPDEATIEGQIQESETKDADSSQPSEMIIEQPPSTVIDAEELGVVPTPEPETLADDNQISRPASGLPPSENEVVSPISQLSDESKEVSGPTTDSTAPVEDNAPQESSPQPNESISIEESNERPDSAISVPESTAVPTSAESTLLDSVNENFPSAENLPNAEVLEQSFAENPPTEDNLSKSEEVTATVSAEDIFAPVAKAESNSENMQAEEVLTMIQSQEESINESAPAEDLPVPPSKVDSISQEMPPVEDLPAPESLDETISENIPLAEDLPAPETLEETINEGVLPAEVLPVPEPVEQTVTDNLSPSEGHPKLESVEESITDSVLPAEVPARIESKMESISETIPPVEDARTLESQEQVIDNNVSESQQAPKIEISFLSDNTPKIVLHEAPSRESLSSDEFLPVIEQQGDPINEPAEEDVSQGNISVGAQVGEISGVEIQDVSLSQTTPSSEDIGEELRQRSAVGESGNAETQPPKIASEIDLPENGVPDLGTQQDSDDKEESAEMGTQAQQAESDLETAATKIQANFRGYMARKTLQGNENEEFNEVDIDDLPPPPDMDSDEQLNAAATTIQANFRGFQARQALKKETEGENDESTEDDLPPPPPQEDNEQLNAAATTIQANFRGFQTRQALKKQTEGANDETTSDELPPPPPPEQEDQLISSVRTAEEAADVLLDSAATRIQATFRGHQVRKTLREANEDGTDVDTGESTAGDSPQVEAIPESEIDEAAAATRIQAGFRGYQVRKSLRNDGSVADISTTEETDTPQIEPDVNAAATTIQANFRGFQARKILAGEKEAVDDIKETPTLPVQDATDISVVPDNSEEAALNSAATTIQANFRGFQTRKALQESTDTTNNTEMKLDDLPVSGEAETTDESELDAAATKIQANFRGFQTRQALQKEKEGQEVETGESIPNDSIVVENTDDLNEAATKIQANFRGYQTRELLKRQTEGGIVHAVPAIAVDSPVSENGLEPASLEAMNAAATTIQANFRGFQARQSLKNVNDEEISESVAGGSPETETVEDPQLNNAATVIQANFRGFQARQLLKKEIETEDTAGPQESQQITSSEDKKPEDASEAVGSDDPALHAAATTIQANFRGFQTRKNLQSGANQEEGAAGESLETLSGSAIAAEESETSLTEVTGDASVITDTSEREAASPPAETPRSPETGEKFKQASNVTSVDEDESGTKEPEKHQETVGSPQQGVSDSSSIDFDSSYSSAATKIQAGVRGFIARRQVQQMRSSTMSTTAPSLPDSQHSAGPSVSLDEDGVQGVISPETQVQNQPNNTIDDADSDSLVSAVNPVSNQEPIAGMVTVQGEKSETVRDEKGLSLDSQLDAAVGDRPKQELRSTVSEQVPNANDEEDELVWQTLQSEMEAAATKIQSNYRGYRTRQRLQREDAVQMPTTSSSTVSSITEPIPSSTANMPNSGEFHDMVVLPPPTPPSISETKGQSTDDKSS